MQKINDLRSAIEYLKTIPGEIAESDKEIDCNSELCGVYRYLAGGCCPRPTREGPAMIFNNLKGVPGQRCIVGINGSPKLVGHIIGFEPEKLEFLHNDSVNHLIAPVEASPDEVKCHEVVHRAEDEDFDLFKLIPAPNDTPEDAGPYVKMGLLYGSDPDTGEKNIAFAKLLIQGKNVMLVNFAPGRHLEIFRRKYEAMGKPMPVSVNIGVDPAIQIASCFEAPTAPLGLDELAIAGGIRNEAVRITDCLTIKEKCIANAEYVIEGEIMPNVRMVEDQNYHGGRSMPEFPGYEGNANPSIFQFNVKAVTTRENPIMQTVLAPSEEHVNMAGIPTEASILDMTEKALPGFVTNVYATHSGGGKLMVFMAVHKCSMVDQGRERQAALLAFSAYFELKHVVLVDDDVDIFDTDDVLWAMNTRFEADKDIAMIPEVICHPLEPSQEKDYTGYRRSGLACKAIFDCTVPFALRDKYFPRAKYLEIDPKPYAPDLF